MIASTTWLASAAFFDWRRLAFNMRILAHPRRQAPAPSTVSAALHCRVCAAAHVLDVSKRIRSARGPSRRRLVFHPSGENRIGDGEHDRADDDAEQAEGDEPADDADEDEKQRNVGAAPDEH